MAAAMNGIQKNSEKWHRLLQSLGSDGVEHPSLETKELHTESLQCTATFYSTHTHTDELGWPNLAISVRPAGVVGKGALILRSQGR